MKLRSLALLGCVVFATSARAVELSQVAPFAVPAVLASWGFFKLEDTHEYKTPIYSAAVVGALAGAAQFLTADATMLKGAKIATVVVPALLSAYLWSLDSKACAAGGRRCTAGQCHCLKVAVGSTLASAALAYYVK